MGFLVRGEGVKEELSLTVVLIELLSASPLFDSFNLLRVPRYIFHEYTCFAGYKEHVLVITSLVRRDGCPYILSVRPIVDLPRIDSVICLPVTMMIHNGTYRSVDWQLKISDVNASVRQKRVGVPTCSQLIPNLEI